MHLSKTNFYTCKKKGSRLLNLRQLLLLLCFAFAAPLAQAQQRQAHPPVNINTAIDKLEYQSFTVRLIPTVEGYYGFDILRQGKLLLHQTENPLPNMGLTYKADAFALAKWLITAYQQNGHFPRVFPPDVEKQLQSSAQPR